MPLLVLVIVGLEAPLVSGIAIYLAGMAGIPPGGLQNLACRGRALALALAAGGAPKFVYGAHGVPSTHARPATQVACQVVQVSERTTNQEADFFHHAQGLPGARCQGLRS
jgi:hypothetical protein